MSKDKPDFESDKPGETDSLSATGMFLRAFGDKPKAEPAPADPLFGSQASNPPRASSEKPAYQSGQSGPSGPGEFTQLFHSLDAKPVAPAAPPLPAEPRNRQGTATFMPPSPSRAEAAAPAVSSGQGSSSGSGPGEFTRVFVGGVNRPPAPAPRVSEELTKPATPLTPGASGSKGFSAPGVSGAASGEGSFTQVFSTQPARPGSQAPEPPVANAPRNAEWNPERNNNDPFFRPQQNPAPPDNSPSVTSLLASLGTPGAPPGRAPEPAPYRPEPTPRSASFSSPEPPEVGSGGVTRLIQRLAQTPNPQTPAPAAPVPPPAVSEPGEFTRIISRMSEPPAPAPQAAASAAPPPAPAFAFPPAPPMPAMPAVAAPVAHAAAPPAPRFAPPPVPAVPLPQAPKPPAIAAPALAPPKSKLEAMVPILLVINTFLLLILLIVVIFLIKSK